MSKNPKDDNVMNFSRQVTIMAMDGKQVTLHSGMEGFETRGMQFQSNGLTNAGAGKQTPVNALPGNFNSPKAPQIPRKK